MVDTPYLKPNKLSFSTDGRALAIANTEATSIHTTTSGKYEQIYLAIANVNSSSRTLTLTVGGVGFEMTLAAHSWNNFGPITFTGALTGQASDDASSVYVMGTANRVIA